jgi:DNA-binding MarR family transcriptional regulator/predicted GNAT family acetyltransferase
VAINRPADAIDRNAAAVRGFNRFYTRRIGVLRAGLLDSRFSLTEVRVLYELAHRDGLTARQLIDELDLDAGYLSRVLGSFEKNGLVTRTPSPADARRRELHLTPAGRRAFAPLNRRAHDEMIGMLRPLPAAAQTRLLSAMREVETLLASEQKPAPVLIRAPRPGDMGWVVAAHGALYATEYGYDITFEALVARIVADFVDKFDRHRDGCWIAEAHGVPVGSIFLVRKSKKVGKLRLFLVDPAVRGGGVGSKLIDECVRFARAAGYQTITLWTQSELLAARRLYERAGFKRVATERHHSFGHDLIGENWELQL